MPQREKRRRQTTNYIYIYIYIYIRIESSNANQTWTQWGEVKWSCKTWENLPFWCFRFWYQDLPANLKKRPATPSRKAVAAEAAEAAEAAALKALPPWRRPRGQGDSSSSHEVIRASWPQWLQRVCIIIHTYIYIYIFIDSGFESHKNLLNANCYSSLHIIIVVASSLF